MESRETKERPPLVPRETLVRYEMVAILAVSVLLMVWSLLSPAPLGGPADPATTPPEISAPWIFAWVQELLRHLPPLMAGVLLPVLLFTLLSLIPFLTPEKHVGGEVSPGTRMQATLLLVLLLGVVILLTLFHYVR